MERSLVHPPLSLNFDYVYEKILKQPKSMTPELRTTGGAPFVAEAKHSRDGRRFVSLPLNNRIYEGDWGYYSNSMGKNGQRIGQYSKPIDDWAKL